MLEASVTTSSSHGRLTTWQPINLFLNPYIYSVPRLLSLLSTPSALESTQTTHSMYDPLPKTHQRRNSASFSRRFRPRKLPCATMNLGSATGSCRRLKCICGALRIQHRGRKVPPLRLWIG